MNDDEMLDLELYEAGNETDRHKIFLKYLARFEETIDHKCENFRAYVSRDEMESDAAMAIDVMFKEMRTGINSADKRRKEAIWKIHPHTLFNRNLTRFARKNQSENIPLSLSIKTSFKKTKRKPVYDNYVSTSTADADTLVEMDYIGSPENAQSEHIRELLDIIAPDKNSNIYLDLCARYIDDKTYQEISEDPRNGRMDRTAIQLRLRKYVRQIGIKLKQEKYGIG